MLLDKCRIEEDCDVAVHYNMKRKW